MLARVLGAYLRNKRRNKQICDTGVMGASAAGAPAGAGAGTAAGAGAEAGGGTTGGAGARLWDLEPGRAFVDLVD